jgi:hypothetical protein
VGIGSWTLPTGHIIGIVIGRFIYIVNTSYCAQQWKCVGSEGEDSLKYMELEASYVENY